jgi:hypothetical protein
MSSSLDNLFNDYNQCQAKYQSQFDYYHQMLNQILANWHAHKQGSMSASVGLYQFQLLCMPMVTEMNETNIKQEADALDIASALRQDITNAQSDYNNLLGVIQQNRTAASGQMAAQELAQAMDKLQQDLHYPGMTKIMGGTVGGGASAIANIQNFINDIKGQFFGNPEQYYTNIFAFSDHYQFSFRVVLNGMPITDIKGSIYGSLGAAQALLNKDLSFWRNNHRRTAFNFSKMRLTMVSVNYQIRKITMNTLAPAMHTVGHYAVTGRQSYPHIYSNLKSIMKITGGSNNTILQSVTSDFTSMNQSVSGISSQIQASMNYLNQSLQQYYSIYKSIFDSFSNYMNYIIQKSGG